MNSQRPLATEGSSSISSMSVSSHGESPLQPLGPLAATDLQRTKKKPGPKRDSKPAQNEKLERNRQAQRTHRERKEQYTKDLEIEVMRLKELFAQATRERDGAMQSRDAALVERDQLLEENQRMREYIQPSNSSSGRDSGYDSMSWTCDSGSSHSDTSGPNLTANAPLQEVADSHIALRRASTRDMAETRGFTFDVPPSDSYTIKVEDTVQRDHSNSAIIAQLPTELPAPPLDYDALGLDFVLTLERPCMGHIQYLHIRAHNNNNPPPPPPPSSSLPSSSSSTTTTIPLSPHLPTPTPPEDVPNDNENLHISGHALMATAPSYTSIMQHHQHQQQQQQHPASKTATPPPYTPQFPPFTQRKDLIHLLNLSANLQICEQEVPPVRAWVKLMQNPRVRNSFGCEELEEVKEWLVGKVCCYRFGAVVDQNDIDEAVAHVCQKLEEKRGSSNTGEGRGEASNSIITQT